MLYVWEQRLTAEAISASFISSINLGRSCGSVGTSSLVPNRSITEPYYNIGWWLVEFYLCDLAFCKITLLTAIFHSSSLRTIPLLITFWRWGSTPVSAYSCALNSKGSSSVLISIFGKASRPHLTLTAIRMRYWKYFAVYQQILFRQKNNQFEVIKMYPTTKLIFLITTI